MAVLYTNNARATLAAALNSSATTLAVSAGQGALFPSPTGSDVFFVTLTNASESVFEIVRVTARATDTFTVVRGQDGTSAAAWAAGDKVELRLNRALLDQLKTDAIPSQSGQFGKFLYTDGTSPSWQYAVLQTSAPTNVSATATSTFGIFVSFTAGANGTENRIYYSTANNVTASSPYIVTGGSAATVTGLSPGTTYYFRAATYNITGPTLSAATVSATTFPRFRYGDRGRLSCATRQVKPRTLR